MSRIASQLVCHPSTLVDGEMSIKTEVSVDASGDMVIVYRLSADLDKLLIPAAKLPVREEGLWRHTCFEAFIMAEGEQAYREFNFSPSGAWQLYAFDSYRQGGPLEPVELIPGRRATCLDGIVFEQRISSGLLPAGDRLRLGLSAVIEQVDGGISYWALQHPSEQPDFHHPDAFLLSLSMNE